MQKKNERYPNYYLVEYAKLFENELPNKKWVEEKLTELKIVNQHIKKRKT